jgi:hypothetical protein
MTDRLPTALDPIDLLWRDHMATKLLVRPFDHTAADLWTPSSIIQGWLYYDRHAIMFIGDTPVRDRGDAPATNEVRVMHMSYHELGHAEILEALNKKERRISFLKGLMFLAPKKHIKAIAKLANR